MHNKMRNKLVIALAAFTMAVTGIGYAAAAQTEQPKSPLAADAPGSFADLVAPLLPAVVNISSTQKMEAPEDYPEMPQFPPGSPFEDFFEEFMQKRGGGAPLTPQASLGSGFVVDAEKGLIVTNNHVVRDAEEVRVTFHDDETVTAEVIGRDEKTDLAVIKVDAKKKLTALKFGDSDVLRVGDWVVAIGNPFGLGGTVTAGIISARARDINSGPYDDFLQTDASINRGNSGGPMFNLKGEVIGINTAIFSPSGGSVGIGFAIPSALAAPVIKQIVEFGRTRRGWLGVRIQSVTPEIGESLGLPHAEGALVASITPKGPAEIAGLQPGDVILSFNSEKLSAMRQLPRLVAETAIGVDSTLTYWRDGKEITAKVKVGELEKAEEDGLLETGGPRSEGKGQKIDSVGLTLSGMSDSLRQDYMIPGNVDGVVVTAVADMSEAAEKGLLPGDVIVEINQQAVKDPQKVVEIIDKAVQNKRTSVLLLLSREGDVRFVALRLDEKKSKAEPGKEKPQIEQ
ncbi:MAG: DegQ family serine endoprotease [Alphaproteobacteria bacterium]